VSQPSNRMSGLGDQAIQNEEKALSPAGSDRALLVQGEADVGPEDEGDQDSSPSETSRAPSTDLESGRGPTQHNDAKAEDRPKVVAWRDLPRKDQLAVITLSRLSEPLVQTSLQVSHHRRIWDVNATYLYLYEPSRTCSISLSGLTRAFPTLSSRGKQGYSMPVSRQLRYVIS
jgi:hypothetical protein